MPGSAGCVPVPATSADNASMERRVSNASDISLQDSPRQGLSTQESVEFIPTRSSKVTPPKPAANPLQFIKVGPCDLYKSAQEQIKKVEEVKKIKAEVRDEAEDWQSNLDNWKCGRRKRQEHIIERVVEVKKLELEEHDRNRRRSKTFNEMMEERNSRGRKASLMVYNDDEANDLSDLGIGTSSGDDNQSLSDQSNNGNHGDEASEDYTYERPNGTVDSGLPEASEEYTYDRAIQNYVNFTETRVKARNNINEETNGHTEATGKTPPPLPFKVRRESSPKIGEKIAFLDEKRRSSTDLSNADKNIKLAKVDVLKRRELFEKPENEDVKSPSKVNVNNSKSIKERLSHLEKHGEQNETKSVNRASSEISGSIKDRLTSLERQKSTEKLNGKEVVMKKRLSNGDSSAPQSVKERLSSLQKQGSEEKIKSPISKVPVEVSIKERVSNLDQSATKEVKKMTPERDPGFSSKLANLQQNETESVFNSKPVAGSERSSSPEDEIFATKRTQFHRSLDSLDVEDDLANGVFERVQSLEDIECLGRRHYPPSASSIEMLVFSSQSGDTDREDSGIHTADVSSSVSQADEPVEDVELVTSGEGFLEGEVVNHRRQLSELSEQLSPLPPIQEMEMFETTTMFINVEESQEKSHSDDVSHGSTELSITVGEGNEDLTLAGEAVKEGVVRRGLSPMVVVEIDINEPVPMQPIQSDKSDTPVVDLSLKSQVNKISTNSPTDSKLIPALECLPPTPEVILETVTEKDSSIQVQDELRDSCNTPSTSEPVESQNVALEIVPVAPEVLQKVPDKIESIESQTLASELVPAASEVLQKVPDESKPIESKNLISNSKTSVTLEITPPTPETLPTEVPINVDTIQTPVTKPFIDQATNNEPKIILVSLKKGNTELLPEKPKRSISSPETNVTVSGVLKLELSMESILKEKNIPSKSVSPDPSALETVSPVVVSFNPKPAPRSVKTYVKDKITSLKVRMSPEVPAKDMVVAGNVLSNAPIMSNAEKRRTVVEVCERVDVSKPAESKSPLTTPFISLQHSKEPLEAVIASRNVVPDTMMLAARETTALPSLEKTNPTVLDEADNVEQIADVVNDVEVIAKEIEQKLIVEEKPFLDMSTFSNGYSIEETLVHTISTSEIPPLNLLSDMELLSDGVSFPLGPPTSAEPPKEKPPPPPTELSDEESSKPKTSLRRIDSTKRIKKEIRRKRSDFLGIEGTTDDSYLEPVLSVAPDMTAFLIEEQRQQKQLYRQSICSESDSNPGESRDSGVELERGHVDDHWLGKQVLTPDLSAQHSRQESEIYGNGSSITSEEDEITKKEREIIEILEKEEQWRYANNSTQDDIGEKLAEKLRQLEQEKLQLEWERAEEERRRIAEESARREDAMRLQAKEQDLKHQETNHITDAIADTNGDGSNLVEVIRAERERLQHEQEELVNQRENLIMRETQQLQRNMKQWDMIPSSAMSLQDISRPQNSYQSNGMPPVVPPAPLNYRLSLPDLQDQVAPVPRQTHRAPPPIPPAKPTRSQAQRDRDNSIRNSRTPSAEVVLESAPLRHNHQVDGVQLRHPPSEAVQMRHSNGHASQQPQAVNGNTSQQMTRQTLQALSAAPRSRIVSTDNWIQAKKKPEAQRNSAAPNYNYQHWLIQEAEHRRITEQQQRNAVTTSPRKVVPNVPQTREKPLPDAIIQTLTQRVQNRAAGFTDAKTNPVRRETQHISRSSPPKNAAIGNVHQNQSPHSVGPVSNGAMNNQMSNQMNGQPKSQMNIPMHVQTTSIDSQEKMLSVSGKKKCSHCTDELGRGAAMIIESLRLFYHIDCFKCCVCHVQLGDGLMGTDVRVRNNKLHCHNCYSSDDGVKFSCV